MPISILKKIWPEWSIGKRIGGGAYGTVYEASRNEYGVENHAAIKIISIPASEAEIDTLRSEGLDMQATKTHFQTIVNDFVNEIRLMVSLEGRPNIVNVKDYKVVEKKDEFGWHIFILMELLIPFAVHTCDHQMTEAEVIKLGCDICTALETCTEEKIIHRDIKPGNILVHKSGDFKLGDFGIARKLENMTGGLSQRYTPKYMAPEVATNMYYDERVDIYSLGIVLYELLNGRRIPFQPNKQINSLADIENAVRRRNSGEDLPAPCDASPAMADLILRACAYDPNMRFSSATEMKQALMSVANGTYQMGASNLDRTTSVRRAPDNYDKTTSVRKAPTASNQKPAPAVNTFGSVPKKKSKMPAVIAAVLAVVLLVGAGIFAIPKLLDGNDSTDPDETSGQTTSEIADYSKLDEEQIATIISEADALAAEEDYEGALVKVQTGLATYPKSAELQDKADEYTEALNAQVKAKTLDEAKNFADSGDYVSAIALIKNAQETQGDDTDYQAALKTYSTAYKTEVIASADGLAANGDYIGALEAVGIASAVIGNDAELSKKAMEYEGEYVAGIIEQADALLLAGDIDSAETLVNNAKKHFPGNEHLTSELGKIESAKQKPLLDVCPPYEVSRCDQGQLIDIAGVSYANALVLNSGYNAYAMFNLAGNYTLLEFDVGHVDGTSMDNGYFEILLDGKTVKTFEISASSMLQHFSIPLNNANQLIIKTSRSTSGTPRYGFINAVVVGGGNNAPSIFEPSVSDTFLLDVCPPYEVSRCDQGQLIDIAGVSYANALVLNSGYNAYAMFNLAGNYTLLEFDVGHVDATSMDTGYFEILLDGKTVKTFEISASSMLQHFSIPLNNANQLIIKTSRSTSGTPRYGFINAVVE